MLTLAQYRLGRVLLHLLVACTAGHLAFHWHGIIRELNHI